MKIVKKFKLRSQAIEASTFLMSKGIPSNVHGNDLLNNFGSIDSHDSGVELEVQDTNFERASELLQQKESGGSASLPSFNFLNIPWKKKSK